MKRTDRFAQRALFASWFPVTTVLIVTLGQWNRPGAAGISLVGTRRPAARAPTGRR
jgi:hypothetical protein